MHRSLLVSTQNVRIMMKIINKKDVDFERSISSSASLLNKQEEEEENPILCNHCLRTSSNGIRCMGICVSDNEY